MRLARGPGRRGLHADQQGEGTPDLEKFGEWVREEAGLPRINKFGEWDKEDGGLQIKGGGANKEGGGLDDPPSPSTRKTITVTPRSA